MLKAVIEFYQDDFNEVSLKTQLELFRTGYKEAKKGLPDLCEVIEYTKTFSPAMQTGLSEVGKLLTLISCDASYKCC